MITIPNGIDTDRKLGIDRDAARAALGLTDEFVFLSLSRHSLQKDTFGLISAFADVAKACPKTHLVVCGRVDDNEYASQVLALRDRLSDRERVHLRGSTLRPDVLLAAADAFVLDSFFEGWALSSMEALAAGVPVILSEVGGAREQLAGGPPRGLLVSNPLGDPSAVNWSSMAKARFSTQSNRDELVLAMTSFANASASIATRQTIAADASDRFSAHRCVERHAKVLREIGSGKYLSP